MDSTRRIIMNRTIARMNADSHLRRKGTRALTGGGFVEIVNARVGVHSVNITSGRKALGLTLLAVAS